MHPEPTGCRLKMNGIMTKGLKGGQKPPFLMFAMVPGLVEGWLFLAFGTCGDDMKYPTGHFLLTPPPFLFHAIPVLWECSLHLERSFPKGVLRFQPWSELSDWGTAKVWNNNGVKKVYHWCWSCCFFVLVMMLMSLLVILVVSFKDDVVVSDDGIQQREWWGKMRHASS